MRARLSSCARIFLNYAGQYYLRQQVDQESNSRVECLIHPQTRVVLASYSH